MTASVPETAGTVLGIDFGGTKVELRIERAPGSTAPIPLGTLGARLISESDTPHRTPSADVRLEIEPGESADSVLDRTFDIARALVEAAGGVDAVGVSTPGIVLDDRVDLAPNVVGWSDLSLSDRLRDGLGAERIVVENDVKAAALAEARQGTLVDVDPGLYVNLGTGIAIAPVLGGIVLRGAHGAAGEIGYGVVGPLPDWSGSGAPLEEYAGGGGLQRRVAASGLGIADVPSLVAAASVSVHESAAKFWLDAVDELARHLLTATLTIDPQRVTLGGGMVRAGRALLGPLQGRLESALPYPPEVVVSAFGARAALIGACILARDALAHAE
ncbi:ROK family protein [Microbacterium sp. ZW T5_56]|uniref:ROK family protein n=1 Tax=Microbacterium sp. ZW T5_56 TaxID=3378081 RepID=UPI003852C0D5